MIPVLHPVMGNKSFGQVAYEEYRNFSDGKSLATGQPIPEWDGLSDQIKTAWNVAARAVVRAVKLHLSDLVDR